MRAFSLLLLIPALAVTASASQVQWTVDSGGNGHWYEVMTDPGTWSHAFAAAASNGGYLATITSAGEDAFVTALLQRTVNSSAFIGGTDAQKEGTWIWSDGPEANEVFWTSASGSLLYANFGYGEPNNAWGGENYLELQNTGLWNDVTSYQPFSYYLLESNEARTPEPASIVLTGAALAALTLFARRARKRLSR